MTRWVFNEDGWTDWQQHDGKGCPCVGWWTQAEYELKTNSISVEGLFIVNGIAAGFPTDGGSWRWEQGWNPIIRYRVRKPKGAEMLEQLVQDVPEPVDA